MSKASVCNNEPVPLSFEVDQRTGGSLTLGTKVAETFRRKTFFRITYSLSFFAALSVGVTFADTALLSNFAVILAAAFSMANQVLGGAYDLSALMSVGALVLISQYLGGDQVLKPAASH